MSRLDALEAAARARQPINSETVLALVALVKELSAALGAMTLTASRDLAYEDEAYRLADAALASAATWMEE